MLAKRSGDRRYGELGACNRSLARAAIGHEANAREAEKQHRPCGGLAHAQADKSPGARVLRLADVRALASDRFAP
jgi:hypothetical protein